MCAPFNSLDDSCQTEATEDDASCAGECKWRGLNVAFYLTVDQNLVGVSDFLAYLDASPVL